MLRRDVLKLMGASVGGLSAAALPLGRTGSAFAAAPDLGRIAYQLSWVKNFQFAGEYIADHKGYFRDTGLQVDLLSGGPNVVVEPVVISGKALVGQSGPDNTANAVNKGGPFKIIGTNYQKSPCAIISMSKAPIHAPGDLIGRTIGIQPNNQVIWKAFLSVNNIDPSKINTVPAQHDFTPLVSGVVDGFFGFSNDDVVQLQEKGNDVTYMLLANHGYKMFNCNYTVTQESLDDPAKRAQLVAFLTGAIRGWQDAVDDPALSAKLTVEIYGKGNGLNEAAQAKSAAATNELMVTPDTEKHGLMWMTDEAIDETIATLAMAGIPAKRDLFTNEILEEVFKGKNRI